MKFVNKKKIQKIVTAGLLSGLIVFGVFSGGAAFAQEEVPAPAEVPADQQVPPADQQAPPEEAQPADETEPQVSTFWRVVQIISLIGALISLGGLIYGAVMWRNGITNNEILLQDRGKRITLAFSILFIIFIIFLIISFIVIRRQQARVEAPPQLEVQPSGTQGLSVLDALLLIETVPLGEVPIRNVQVKLLFNQDVALPAIESNVTISRQADGQAVVGEFEVDGPYVTFRPNNTCPTPHTALRCFDENTAYDVTINSALTSQDGDEFRCSVGQAAGQCRFSFVTGDQIDANAPSVRVTQPFDGQAVPVDSAVLVEGLAVDDVSVGAIKFTVNGDTVGTAIVSGGELFPEFRGSANWDTTGLTVGSEHVIRAVASDLAGFETVSRPVTAEILPLYCFDGEQNEDEEGVDCGGPTCRTCQGGSCEQNSDCASGLCFDGVCQEFPVIQEVIEEDGAPGNYITIRGQNFGSEPGEIIFLGGDFDDDDITGAIPNCDVYWSDQEVIIEVPEDAASGALRINTAAGLFDTTSDNKGIQFDFVVNDIARPGLCQVSPNAQTIGDSVQLIGKGLGEEVGEVLFGQFNAERVEGWSPEFISDVFVPSIEPGKMSVQVRVGDGLSNPVLFTALQSPILPLLTALIPDRGPAGQMFSVQGENFVGNVLVKFLNPRTGEETLANTDLPESCQRLQSSSQQRAFRVPRLEPGIYQVFVETDIGQSNKLDFTVNQGERIPGLCGMEPDNGPVGIEVRLFGEGFGANTGAVRFNPRIDDTAIIDWSSDEITALVPAVAQSGPVQVIHENGALSNPMVFTIGQCSPDTCETGFECCANGACQVAGSCEVNIPFCTYSWVFSTGDDLGGPPRVIEDPTCRNNTQSPSPYRDTQDACLNAMISARFSRNMRDETLTHENMELLKCNTGGTFDGASCSTSVNLGDVTLINSEQVGEGFIARPQLQLESDTWYQVELSTGFTADNGLSMVEPYIWRFKTQQGEGLCEVDHVEVTPPKATLRQLNEFQRYTGVPTALNCNILDGESFTWRWLSGDTSKAIVEPSDGPRTRARSEGPTDPGPPVEVFGGIPEFSVEDSGLLTIRLLPPEVVAKWPNCGQACINAGLGARFDQSMDENSLRANNVKLFECSDQACSRDSLSEVGIRSLNYNDTDFAIYFLPATDLLKPATSYRVVLQGLRGANSLPLGGLNFDISGDGEFDSYSWIFSSREEEDLCEIDHVDVAPLLAQSFLIPEEFNYFALPVSPPDACSDSGQILNGEVYDWAWMSTQSEVGSVTSLDDVPPPGVIDPYQFVTSAGQGKTTIQATAQSQTGEGSFEVFCGFQEDLDCPAPATLESHGVGRDTCCYARPTVESSNPKDGAEQVCTTLAIQVQFDAEMDEGSVVSNIVLEQNFGATPCPAAPEATAWNKVRNLARSFWNWLVPTIKAQEVNWCPVDAGVTVGRNNTGSFAQVFPRGILPSDTQFRVRSSGDINLADGVAEGIRNFEGVAMNGEHTISFTTGQAECSLDILEVIIDPPGEAGRADAFFCAVRNDCPSDINPQAEGNQHTYQAIGRDISGYAVPAEFNWVVTGPPLVELNTEEGDVVEVTSLAENGESSVTVFGQAVAPSSGQVTRTIDTVIFLCENPWPSILDFPYTDQAFNFDLFYCRDFGEPGFQDDLPPLSDPIDTENIGDSLKESLFIVE